MDWPIQTADELADEVARQTMSGDAQAAALSVVHGRLSEMVAEMRVQAEAIRRLEAALGDLDRRWHEGATG